MNFVVFNDLLRLQIIQSIHQEPRIQHPALTSIFNSTFFIHRNKIHRFSVVKNIKSVKLVTEDRALCIELLRRFRLHQQDAPY